MIKIVEIELSEGLNDFYVEDKYEFVLLTVFYKNRVLETIKVPVNGKYYFTKEFLIETISLKSGDKVLREKLFEKIEENITRIKPGISVIVCTRDRANSLEVCLKSLKEIDYPEYEVIVVDNCTKDDSVLKVTQKFNVKYVKENIPGLDWARNRGIIESSFDIIAFIDDDAIASKEWLNGIALGFNDSDIMAVTGLTLPAELETPAQVDFELYGGMGKGFYPFTISKPKLKSTNRFWSSAWGVGANMAFRKTIINKIGGFDVSLDVGTPTCGGGDIEMFQRVVVFGYKLRYEPLALVKHYHRKDYKALRKQIFNNGKSFPAYLLSIKEYSQGEQFSLLKFAVIDWLLKWHIVRIVKSILQSDRKTLILAYYEIMGSLASLFSYSKSKRINLKIIKSLTNQQMEGV